jgi:hypothetical protein
VLKTKRESLVGPASEDKSVLSTELIMGSRESEQRRWGAGRSMAHPVHGDKELHVNGHHFVLLYCSKQMNLFSPPLEDKSSVRFFRARIKHRGPQLGHKSPVSLRTHWDTSGSAVCVGGGRGVRGEVQPRELGGSLSAHCPIPDGSSQAKRTPLNPILQAVHVTVNCWVSFVFLIGK